MNAIADGTSEASTSTGASTADSTLSLPQGIKLVCIDMDGTLLNSDSKISARTASAVKSSLARGDLSLILATGKARPAAIAACEEAGLTGLGPCTSLRLFMYVPWPMWGLDGNIKYLTCGKVIKTSMVWLLSLWHFVGCDDVGRHGACTKPSLS
jgi:hypothetical protein